MCYQVNTKRPTFRFTYYLHGKQKILGLGSTKKTTLEEARSRATEYRRLVDQGIDPRDFRDKDLLVPKSIKGVSTLVDANGETKMQWIKTNTAHEQQLEAMRAAIDALKSDLPRDSYPYQRQLVMGSESNLLNAYILTDFHLGMLAWGEETLDADWDTELAEDLLIRWFQTAITTSPAAGRAVLAQMGDFLHWDGFDAVTPTSGHILDADTRFQKLVRTAIRVIRRVIALMLQKYKYVHIIMADGNHDPASGAWMREFLAAFYEGSEYVSVDTSASTYYRYIHGETLLCFHHGHKRGVKSVDQTFVGRFREEFGMTKHAYGHIGHLHQDVVHETPLMKVEQHRTLAPADAYASRGGWVTGRDAKVITYHKEYGEVGRVTINPKMVI